MEILGALSSAVTIAALFKNCVDAFELIQAGRRQEKDLRRLRLRLWIERGRLYNWGTAMGLTDENTPGSEEFPRPINSIRDQELVKECLELILEMFLDAEKIRDRYGCKELPPQLQIGELASDPIAQLSVSFSHFKTKNRKAASPNSAMQKIRWVIYDRKKFESFVSKITELIDGLEKVTVSIFSKASQDREMLQRITRITEPDTLSMIADACGLDHPQLSKAASTRAETRSMPSSTRVHVEDWFDKTCPDSNLTVVGDVESLNVTELKHQNYRLMKDLRSMRALVEQLQSAGRSSGQGKVRSALKKRARSPSPSKPAKPSKRATTFATNSTSMVTPVASLPQVPTGETSTISKSPERLPMCDQLNRDVEVMVLQIMDPVPLSIRHGSDEMDAWALLSMATPDNRPGSDICCSRCHLPYSEHFVSFDMLFMPSRDFSSARSVSNPADGVEIATSAASHDTLNTGQSDAVWKWIACCLLACILQNRGVYDAIGLHIAQATNQFKCMLINEEPMLLNTVYSVGVVLASHRQFRIRNSIMQASYQDCRERLTPTSPVMVVFKFWFEISQKRNLVKSQVNSNDLKHAQEDFLAKFGPSHPATIAAVFAHAYKLQEEGKFVEFEIASRKTVEMSSFRHGPKHLQSICALLLEYRSQSDHRNFEEALVGWKMSVEYSASVLGMSHPYILRTKHRVAKTLMRRRDLRRSGLQSAQLVQLNWEVLEGSVKMLGRRSPFTLCAKRRYEYACQRRIQWECKKRGDEEVIRGINTRETST